MTVRRGRHGRDTHRVRQRNHRGRPSTVTRRPLTTTGGDPPADNPRLPDRVPLKMAPASFRCSEADARGVGLIFGANPPSPPASARLDIRQRRGWLRPARFVDERVPDQRKRLSCIGVVPGQGTSTESG